MKRSTLWLLGCAIEALALVGCDRRNSACTELLTSDESSNGTFSYADGDGGPPGAPLSGDVGPSSELTVTGVGGSDGVVDGCPYGPTDDDTIIVNGQFVDATGTPQPFCLQVNGVTQGQSVNLGSGSVACLLNADACTPLTGTIATTTFLTSCVSAPDSENDLCALDIAGTLKATASWSGGSFSVDLTLEHSDSCD